ERDDWMSKHGELQLTVGQLKSTIGQLETTIVQLKSAIGSSTQNNDELDSLRESLRQATSNHQQALDTLVGEKIQMQLTHSEECNALSQRLSESSKQLGS